MAFGNFDVKAVFEGRSRSLEGADQHVDAQRHVCGLEDRNLFRSGFNLCLIVFRKSRRRDDNRSLCFKRVSENLRESGEMRKIDDHIRFFRNIGRIFVNREGTVHAVLPVDSCDYVKVRIRSRGVRNDLSHRAQRAGDYQFQAHKIP